MSLPFKKKQKTGISEIFPKAADESHHAVCAVDSKAFRAHIPISPIAEKLNARKAAAVAYGSRAEQALAIADIKLLELLKDLDAMLKAMEVWVGRVGSDPRTKQTKPMNIRDNLASLIHAIAPWRALKQGPSAVKRFAQERADLAERFKTCVPKEAIAWATTQIANNNNLASFIPEMVRARSYYIITEYLLEGKPHLQRFLAGKILKLEDMDSWTVDDTINALFERNEVHLCLMSELHSAIAYSYAVAASSYWAYFNQTTQRQHAGFIVEKGLCNENGAPDCTCERCASGKSFKQSPKERFEWLEHMAGAAVMGSKAWGDFAPTVNILHDVGMEARAAIMWGASGAGAVIWQAGHDLVEERRIRETAASDAHKDRKQLKKELEHARAQLAERDRQIEKMRKARAKKNDAEQVIQVPDDDEDLKQARRQIDLLGAELRKKEEALARMRALLNSILSSTDTEEKKVNVANSPEEIRERRGIIIGGHYGLVTKLRKALPNCVFYSADAKSLDEDAVRNGDYILFITGYVNHCLTGHALRLARLNDIPCTYTDRTNISLVLEDVALAFRGEAVPVATP